MNTSGLRQAAQETYPGDEAIRLFRQLGGEIVTLGSDAHWAGHLGFGLERGCEAIRAAGFPSIARYHSRKLRLLAIV